MGAKTKGTGAERELIHKLWALGWTACRVAGSGSMLYPSPDIIASKDKRHLAIECKTTGKDYQYFDVKEIKELMEFSKKSGAEPWLGIRFSREAWLFIHPSELIMTKNQFGIARKKAKEKGKNLDLVLRTKHL